MKDIGKLVLASVLGAVAGALVEHLIDQMVTTSAGSPGAPRVPAPGASHSGGPQIVTLTPQDQTVAVASGQSLVLQAPSGGTIVSIQGTKAPLTVNSPSFNLSAVDALSPAVHRVVWKSAANVVYNVTITVTG